ncbi:B3 domain-containing protein-like protein [Salvia divinorum]|uniref:B3 domain-containing protein-like protein n=1 Tax=Salvia divinorum TaxID=28513 RepID=A0ABD1HTC6_SALDI
MASSNFQGKRGQPAYPLNKDPSFSKCFSALHNIDSIRIPPEWVMQYGSDVPFQCVLFMPNRFCWTVRMLNIASRCHFNIGWKEFVIDNHIHNNDTLVFTHKGEGEFHVQRYDSVATCPPQVDYDAGLYWEQQIEMEPDLDTSDDYVPSETGTETEGDSDDVLIEYPSLNITLTEKRFDRTLELPLRFYKTYLRMSSLQAPVYFNVDGNTWLMSLENDAGKIRVKCGWKRFAEKNNLRPGMRLNFQLVDVDEVQFFVIIYR